MVRTIEHSQVSWFLRRVGLEVDKKTFVTGQPVYVTICISNTSPKAIVFSRSDEGWLWDYDFIVTTNHAQKVGHPSFAEKFIKERTNNGITSYRGYNMPPAGIYLERDCISAHYDLSAPGEYEIVAVYQVLGRTNMVPVRSGAIHIKIVTEEKPAKGGSP